MARVGERRNVYRVIWGNLKVRNYVENLGVDGRIVQWRPLIIIADNVINRLLLSKSVVPKPSIYNQLKIGRLL